MKDNTCTGSYFPQPPHSPSSLSPWSSLMMSRRNQNSGGRKRALSQSPSEAGFDVESLTRSSEACLRLSVNSGGGGANRDSCHSSNTSGSYGHLSACEKDFWIEILVFSLIFEKKLYCLQLKVRNYACVCSVWFKIYHFSSTFPAAFGLPTDPPTTCFLPPHPLYSPLMYSPFGPYPLAPPFSGPHPHNVLQHRNNRFTSHGNNVDMDEDDALFANTKVGIFHDSRQTSRIFLRTNNQEILKMNKRRSTTTRTTFNRWRSSLLTSSLPRLSRKTGRLETSTATRATCRAPFSTGTKCASRRRSTVGLCVKETSSCLCLCLCLYLCLYLCLCLWWWSRWICLYRCKEYFHVLRLVQQFIERSSFDLHTTHFYKDVGDVMERANGRTKSDPRSGRFRRSSTDNNIGGCPQEGEPDFYETNCHWKGCHKEFKTQEELVKVSQHCHRSNG